MYHLHPAREVATWILLLLFSHLPWMGVSGFPAGFLTVAIKMASPSVGSSVVADAVSGSLACSSTVTIRMSSSLASLSSRSTGLGLAICWWEPYLPPPHLPVKWEGLLAPPPGYPSTPWGWELAGSPPG